MDSYTSTIFILHPVDDEHGLLPGTYKQSTDGTLLWEWVP